MEVFFFNEALKWQKPSLYSNNSDICCAFFLTSRSQATDGELIGAVECSCADCWTVKVLNQKVSLLLIIHNATNSRVRLSSFFPQPSINILAVVQKERKKNKFTHNYHSGMSRLPADVCLDYNGSRGRASPNPDKMCFLQSQRSGKHAERCKAHRSPLVREN